MQGYGVFKDGHVANLADASSANRDVFCIVGVIGLARAKIVSLTFMAGQKIWLAEIVMEESMGLLRAGEKLTRSASDIRTREELDRISALDITDDHAYGLPLSRDSAA